MCRSRQRQRQTHQLDEQLKDKGTGSFPYQCSICTFSYCDKRSPITDTPTDASHQHRPSTFSVMQYPPIPSLPQCVHRNVCESVAGRTTQIAAVGNCVFRLTGNVKPVFFMGVTFCATRPVQAHHTDTAIRTAVNSNKFLLCS